jgi:hypothetical protein
MRIELPDVLFHRRGAEDEQTNPSVLNHNGTTTRRS